MAKRRKSGEGTIRLRKDGRWEGRVVIGYDKEGLPRTKGVLAKTKAECAKKLDELKATVTPETPIKVKPDMTLGDWLDYWYQSLPSLACASLPGRPTKTGSTATSFPAWVTFR